MNDIEKEQLRMEIKHIFDSGANEIRIFEMVKSFIESRGVANTLPMHNFSSCSNERADNLEEELNRIKEFVGFDSLS